ncbi:9844_t:CDS:2, partial [Dentiscutata erythropus]
MSREALIKNLECKLLSEKCDLGKITIQYLNETEKLLSRQLRLTIEAGPSKIVKIIEDEDLIIETKSTFVKLEIPEILAGIANNLSPRDILNFLHVN